MGQPLSSPHQIPRLFQVFPTEALIFIKPSEVHRTAYMYSWVNTGQHLQSSLCTSSLLNSTRGYVHSATIATVVAHHRQTTISRTFPRPMWNSPTFSRFSSWMATLKTSVTNHNNEFRFLYSDEIFPRLLQNRLSPKQSTLDKVCQYYNISVHMLDARPVTQETAPEHTAWQSSQW